MDGSALPGTLSETASEKVEITSGSLVLGRNLQCMLTRQFRTTTNGTALVTSETDACTWTRTGSAAFLTIDGVGAIPGTWDKDAATLDFTIGGHVLTFVRD